MKSYKDLDIYTLSYDLALKVHELTLRLPQYELFEEGSQARRSSKGISSCIVSGISFLNVYFAICNFQFALLSFNEVIPHDDSFLGSKGSA
jgi:four helix bundle protein